MATEDDRSINQSINQSIQQAVKQPLDRKAVRNIRHIISKSRTICNGLQARKGIPISQLSFCFFLTEEVWKVETTDKSWNSMLQAVH